MTTTALTLACAALIVCIAVSVTRYALTSRLQPIRIRSEEKKQRKNRY